MKLLIAGSRHFTNIDRYDIKRFIDLFNLEPSEIVAGGATGPDCAARWYAINEDMKLKEFIAEWDKYGKAAGPIRNKKMAVYSDALILIWDGKSNGSRNMKEEMLALNKPVYELIIRSHNDSK